MKKIFKYISLLFIPVLFMVSCTPEEYELGEVDVTSDELVEGIAFEIVHDTDNPNIVYLKSLMDSKYTPLWNHPQGRSQEREVELKMPFEGTYNVQFGVQTRGGVVYGDTVTFEVEDFYAGFIDDPLWTMVSGGVGNSKTWYLDLDAEGVSRYFLSPMYFFTASYEWDNLHSPTGENYIDADVWLPESAIVPNMTDGTATWYWLADWPGNQWMCDAADFGTMTFDLKSGANVVVDQEAYGLGKSVGSYMLDVENHTIQFTDAFPLHDSNRDGEVKEATEFRILYINDDAMQIMVVPSGVCYNYISEDYSENWTPGEVEEPEPTLPEGWKEDISKTVNTSIIWKLSESNPLDWANLDGSMMNGWQAPEDYPDWLGTPDPSVYGDFSMTLNSANNSVVFVNPDGTTTEGTYELSEKGIYSFDVDVPSFAVIGWASFAADANNELRILQVEKDAAGNVTGMWIGARSSEKDEYMAYHLVTSGGSS